MPQLYSNIMLAPNYSTDRFWIVSSASNISMCFFGLALLAHWRALQRPPFGFLRWEAQAVLAVLGSGFCYEVFLSSFLLTTVLLFSFEVAAKRHSPLDGRI